MAYDGTFRRLCCLSRPGDGLRRRMLFPLTRKGKEVLHLGHVRPPESPILLLSRPCPSRRYSGRSASVAGPCYASVRLQKLLSSSHGHVAYPEYHGGYCVPQSYAHPVSCAGSSRDRDGVPHS